MQRLQALTFPGPNGLDNSFFFADVSALRALAPRLQLMAHGAGALSPTTEVDGKNVSSAAWKSGSFVELPWAAPACRISKITLFTSIQVEKTLCKAIIRTTLAR